MFIFFFGFVRVGKDLTCNPEELGSKSCLWCLSIPSLSCCSIPRLLSQLWLSPTRAIPKRSGYNLSMTWVTYLAYTKAYSRIDILHSFKMVAGRTASLHKTHLSLEFSANSALLFLPEIPTNDLANKRGLRAPLWIRGSLLNFTELMMYLKLCNNQQNLCACLFFTFFRLHEVYWDCYYSYFWNLLTLSHESLQSVVPNSW